MKKLLPLAFAFIFLTNVKAQVKTPAEVFPGLFAAVQMAHLYPDGKTFADAMPKRPAKEILADYNRLKNSPGFNLKQFADQNFEIPLSVTSGFVSDISAGVRKHIDTLWNVLQRKADKDKEGSRINLPYRYIVPGGRFRESYYWDTYFTMQGLEESGRWDVIENMVKNFAYVIDTYGHIPNGMRTYYISRSQPPFFALMVELLAKHKGNKTITKYLPELLKEYKYWMDGVGGVKVNSALRHVVKMPDGSILNRYCDASRTPREESYREDILAAQQSKQKAADYYQNARSAAESGWDFCSRWFVDGKHLTTIQTTKLVPVDLNCLLYHLEQVLARSYSLRGDAITGKIYLARADARRKSLMKFCWNEAEGIYQDYNWTTHKKSPWLTIATTSPLFFNVATPHQADKIAVAVENKLLQPGGIACTMFNTGEQWDRPNGWAPLEFMAIMGLRAYGKDKLAEVAALRWIKLNKSAFESTGKLLEKYNIENVDVSVGGGGEYPLQDGFGWTNGVLLKLMNIYKQ
ncbi:alpha,alpha-trehalase TreF [Mucilaginibacter ginkgonis]|nr:alpha,alpha-trehalase TreF [Mucilaginibacter ginkgonis]